MIIYILAASCVVNDITSYSNKGVILLR